MRSTNQIIQSANTAIRRTKPSRPAQYLFETCQFQVGSVLDYGCGHGEDVIFYSNQWMNAQGYDQIHSPALPALQTGKKYDNVVLTYVLNTIAPVSRYTCLLDAVKLLVNGGRLMITVRADVERTATKKGWPKHLDGYWSNERRGMFQADISMYRLKALVKHVFSAPNQIKDFVVLHEKETSDFRMLIIETVNSNYPY